MTVTVDIKVDLKEVTRSLKTIERSAIPKATARALNRTAQQVRTQARRDIAKETGLKQKDVNEQLTIFKASWRKLYAAVQASGRALNLIRFKAKQTQLGVVASPWGKQRLYRGTFIANQGRTVFKRKTQGGKRVGRLPIQAVHGPSIPREFVRKKIQDAMRRVVAERWPINFRQDLAYYLSRLK